MADLQVRRIIETMVAYADGGRDLNTSGKNELKSREGSVEVGDEDKSRLIATRSPSAGSYISSLISKDS